MMVMMLVLGRGVLGARLLGAPDKALGLSFPVLCQPRLPRQSLLRVTLNLLAVSDRIKLVLCAAKKLAEYLCVLLHPVLLLCQQVLPVSKTNR